VPASQIPTNLSQFGLGTTIPDNGSNRYGYYLLCVSGMAPNTGTPAPKGLTKIGPLGLAQWIVVGGIAIVAIVVIVCVIYTIKPNGNKPRQRYYEEY